MERLRRGRGAGIEARAELRNELRELGAQSRAAHPDARGPYGRRGRLEDFFLPAVLVTVEAGARFASEQAGSDALAGERRKAVTRLLVLLPVDRFHHRVPYVEAPQVHQLRQTPT